MKRYCFFPALLLFVATTVALPQVAMAKRDLCAAAAKNALRAEVLLVRFGDLTGGGKPGCVAVVPQGTNQGEKKILSRRGIVLQANGDQWRELLRFDDEIRNEQGYIGIDFIDPDYHYGLALETDDQRSDGTKAFTMYFTFLDAKLKPEGLAVEVSWNPKTRRFQEYAPNELDPPDFKPEIRNPPVRKSR